MRATLIPALFLGLFAMVVIGCGSSMSQTIYRTQVSQQQLLQDVATLRDTSGVENVTYTYDVTGAARMVVTYEAQRHRGLSDTKQPRSSLQNLEAASALFRPSMALGSMKTAFPRPL